MLNFIPISWGYGFLHVRCGQCDHYENMDEIQTCPWSYILVKKHFYWIRESFQCKHSNLPASPWDGLIIEKSRIWLSISVHNTVGSLLTSHVLPQNMDLTHPLGVQHLYCISSLEDHIEIDSGFKNLMKIFRLQILH